MIGYLLYNRAESQRNEWFIGELTSQAAERSLDLRLLIEEELCLADGILLHRGAALPMPDLVIARIQNYPISSFFEDAGVRVFNSSRVSLICNDKARTYELARSLSIPIMQTHHVTSEGSLEPGLYTYPSVIKPTDGKGGKDVCLASTPDELTALYESTFKGRDFVVQALASDIGRDTRVYVMGSRVLCAFTRISDSDFRSNFCLGGRAMAHSVTPEEERMISAFCDALHPDFVGIDFIYHNGRPIFNEIEDSVGSRMVYANTDINVAAEYISYIVRQIKGDC